MRYLVATLVVLLLATPTFAATATAIASPAHNGEIDLGGSYAANEHGRGRSGSLSFDMLAPLVGQFKIGPEARFFYDNGATGLGFGPAFELNLGSNARFQPFLWADGVRWAGSYESQVKTQAAVGGGLKIGLDRAYIRATVVRQRVFGSGQDTDSTVFSFGIGVRL